MKKKVLAVAVLALSIVAHAIPTGPPPTCNPFSDPSCTLDTGCQGGPCLMPTISLFGVTSTSQFVAAHSTK